MEDTLNAAMKVLNAAGIPLLVVGVTLLVLAYQRATQAYREGSTHLRDENDRLRKRLTEMDGQYFAVMDKAAKLAARSDRAIEELQARKIGLLAAQSETKEGGESVLAEVKKINTAISDLQEMPERVRQTIRYELDATATRVAELAEQVGDTTARLAIIAVVTSPEIHQHLAAEIAKYPRGLVKEPETITKQLELASVGRLLGTDPTGQEGNLQRDDRDA